MFHNMWSIVSLNIIINTDLTVQVVEKDWWSAYHLKMPGPGSKKQSQRTKGNAKVKKLVIGPMYHWVLANILYVARTYDAY